MTQQSSNDIGKKPKQGWIDVDLLIIDHNYQRDAIPKHVQAILLGFNWRYFQPPTVCPSENEKYWVIDGQQRVLAAKLHPAVDSVPCYIINTPLTKDQADAFIRVNRDRRNVNQVNMYWAGVAAEDEKYLVVQRVLHSANAEVNPSLGLVKVNTTSAVGCILLSITACGEETVGLALQIICEAKPTVAGVLSSNLIRALSILLRDHEGISKSLMIELLRRTDLDLLNSDALSARRILGGQTVRLLSAEILKRYLKLKKAVKNEPL